MNVYLVNPSDLAFGVAVIAPRWLYVLAAATPRSFGDPTLMSHPEMSQEEIRVRTRRVWDQFYSFGATWRRSRVAHSLRARLAFVLLSKLYRQMYANTGIATDSARTRKANNCARRIAWPAQKLFRGAPMQDLQVPTAG